MNLSGGAGRPTLDRVATILMMVTAVVLLAVALSGHWQRPDAQGLEPIELSVPVTVSLEGAPTEGCASAQVALIEYADFQCPACGVFARDVLPVIRGRYLDDCSVLFAFRHLPVSATHPDALNAAEAAACADHQDRFWSMHDLLYAEEGDLSPKGLSEKARAVGLRETDFEACLNSDMVLPRIRLDAGEGITLGVSATPTLFFGTVEGDNLVRVTRRVAGAMSVRQVEETLEALLREARSPSIE